MSQEQQGKYSTFFSPVGNPVTLKILRSWSISD